MRVLTVSIGYRCSYFAVKREIRRGGGEEVKRKPLFLSCSFCFLVSILTYFILRLNDQLFNEKYLRYCSSKSIRSFAIQLQAACAYGRWNAIAISLNFTMSIFLALLAPLATEPNPITTVPLVSLPAWIHTARLCKLKRMCLQVLCKSGELASGILSSPLNQLFRIRAEVSKLLSVAERFDEQIGLEREALLEVLERNLLVDDRLARGFGHDGGDFLPAV